MGDLFGSIGNAFSNALGGALGGAAVSSAQALAFPTKQGGLSGHDALVANRNFARETRRFNEMDKYSYNVTGLRNAGLNPILAAKGFQSGNSNNQPVTGVADKAQRDAVKVNKQLANLHSAKLASEVNLNNAAAQKNKAEASQAPSKIENFQADTQMKKQLGEQAASNISLNIDKGIAANAQANKDNASESEIRQRINNLKQEFQLTGKQIEKISAELPGMLVDAEIDKTAYAKIIKYINRALPAINSASGIGGAISIYKKIDKIYNRKRPRMDLKTGELFK